MSTSSLSLLFSVSCRRWALVLLCGLAASSLARAGNSQTQPTGGEVLGVVKDSAGRPLEGVAVRFTLGPQQANTVTAANGSYRLQDVTPGLYELRFVLPGYALTRASNIDIRPGSSQTVNATLTWLDPQTGGLRLTVQDALPAPVFGSNISVQGPSGTRTGSTDLAGTAVFLGLPAGRHAVSVSRAGYLSIARELITIRAGFLLDYRLRLRPDPSQRGSIVGIVVNANGVPVSAATIRISEGVSAGAATTGPDGTYAIRDLLTGRYQLTVSANNLATQVRSNIGVEPGQSNRQEFTLVQRTAQLGSIAGRITTGEGLGLAGAQVELVSGPNAGQRVNSTSGGQYQLRDLQPDSRHGLVVRSTAGYARGVTGITVTAGRTTELNVTLVTRTATPGGLSGLVTDGNGSPVPGVLVETLQGPSPGVQVLTGAEGRYQLEDLGPGDDYLIRFSKTGYDTARAGLVAVAAGTITTLNQRLNRINVGTGTLRGTVKRATGSAVADATVTVLEGSRTVTIVRTNLAGEFNVSNLPAVDGYKVRVEKADHQTAERSNVSIRPGQTTTLAFTLTVSATLGTLRGRVTNLSSTAIAGARIRVLEGPTMPAEAVTNAAGDYALEFLRTGVYRVEVIANGYRTEQRSGISVTAGQERFANFQLLR